MKQLRATLKEILRTSVKILNINGFPVSLAVMSLFVSTAVLFRKLDEPASGEARIGFFKLNSEDLVIVSVTLTLTAYLMLRYLNDNKSDNKSENKNRGKDSVWSFITKTHIQDDLIELYAKNFISNRAKDVEMDQVVQDLKNEATAKQIITKVNNEYFSDLESKFSKEIVEELKYKELIKSFNETKKRLSDEINSLSRRGNLNLIIGVFTTLAAMGVLLSTVYGDHKEIKDMISSLTYFMPRISTIVLTEVFSFFFLRLYRSSLSDIKYFQNELTNIDLRIVSLKTALYLGDKTSAGKVITEMSKTERNFILKKGETTVDIEHFKTQYQFDRFFSEGFNSVMGNVQKFRKTKQSRGVGRRV